MPAITAARSRVWPPPRLSPSWYTREIFLRSVLLHFGQCESIFSPPGQAGKDDIESISHVYLDLDYGGTPGLDAVQNSDLVPLPNYVLNTSPEKFQRVWKVERITIDEAEALNQALVSTRKTRGV